VSRATLEGKIETLRTAEDSGRSNPVDILCAGEKRLMRAVLEDAINLIGKRCKEPHVKARRSEEDFEKLKRWFHSSEDSDWPFSFLSICEALGLEPGYIRSGVDQKVREIQGRQMVNERGGEHAPTRERTVPVVRRAHVRGVASKM